jgi:hypothetical protein
MSQDHTEGPEQGEGEKIEFFRVHAVNLNKHHFNRQRRCRLPTDVSPNMLRC